MKLYPKIVRRKLRNAFLTSSGLTFSKVGELRLLFYVNLHLLSLCPSHSLHSPLIRCACHWVQMRLDVSRKTEKGKSDEDQQIMGKNDGNRKNNLY